MGSLEEDQRFVREMAVAWEHRTTRARRALFASWINRLNRELLLELCRRQRLDSAASCFEVIPLFTEGSAERLVEILEKTADHTRKAGEASQRATDVALLIDAVRDVVFDAFAGVDEDALLRQACLRRRQLGRALRRLDDESRRILLDLADA